MEARYDDARARWIGRLGAGLLRLLGSTWRHSEIGSEHLAACRASGRGFIFALWHGNLFPLAFLRRNEGVIVLVSLNRDGEYITQVIERMGYRTVRGSTSRGAGRSLLEMVRLGRAGQEIAFTPDGPRGPRHRVQPGVLLCAQRARIPILPLAIAARPRRQLDSWDRFLIPAPGARVVMGFGPPLEIPAELEREAMLAAWTPRLEEALRSLEARCAEACGCPAD